MRFAFTCPKKPERFAGGKLRGGNTPVTADVYLAGGNNEIYAVIFIYDLPKKSEDMSDEQKAELFFGTWRGTVEHDREVIEKQTGQPVAVQFAEQKCALKNNVDTHSNCCAAAIARSPSGQEL